MEKNTIKFTFELNSDLHMTYREHKKKKTLSNTLSKKPQGKR